MRSLLLPWLLLCPLLSVTSLCRRFFKSPNFDGWYRQRHKEMTQKLEALHLEAICDAVRSPAAVKTSLSGA